MPAAVEVRSEGGHGSGVPSAGAGTCHGLPQTPAAHAKGKAAAADSGAARYGMGNHPSARLVATPL